MASDLRFVMVLMIVVSSVWAMLALPSLRQRLPKIYLIARSWWLMLAALCACYVIAKITDDSQALPSPTYPYQWLLIAFFVLIGLRGGYEIRRIWCPQSKSMLIEKIKNVIIEMVHHSTENIKINFSDYLSQKLNYDYTYLSNLFSEVQGTTIEQFIISHKTERIKELIIYGELNITEIAWKMNYSSVAHLSSQFKKVTGLSPSHFKKLKDKRRNPIEEIGNLENRNNSI